MQPDARHFVLLGFSLVAIAALLAGCGSSAECVIDSDCASLAQRCEANACVPLGLPPMPDLGHVDMGADAAPTDGGPRDGGPTAQLNGTFYAVSDPTTSIVGASFTETPAGMPSGCTSRDEGPCVVTLCPAGTSSAVPRNAGMLTLSGGAAPVTLVPNADDTYSAGVVTGPLFAGGTALTFEGTGATDGGVPAFTGMVTSPNIATLTTPAIVDATPIIVSRTADTMLAWTPSGPAGMVEATFSALDSTGGSVSVRCRFVATAFSGAVPFAAFNDFPAGMSGSYSFSVEAETELMLDGDWNVTLSARSPMPTAAGVPSSGAATF